MGTFERFGTLIVLLVCTSGTALAQPTAETPQFKVGDSWTFARIDGFKNERTGSFTHTVAAVEAFLQIKVRGKVGEGDFAGLVSEGQREKLIPSDIFTKEVFKTIISVLMRERKEKGDAHVKQSYGSEGNAKIVLNLAMIFIQHCMSK